MSTVYAQPWFGEEVTIVVTDKWVLSAARVMFLTQPLASAFVKTESGDMWTWKATKEEMLRAMAHAGGFLR